MKQCKKCSEVKYWFQFYTIDEILYTIETDICKKCAKWIEIEAIRDYLNKTK